MADHKKLADHRTALYWIDPAKIKVVPGRNARDMTAPDNIDHVRHLADLIRENGFKDEHPLELDDALSVTAGHCRHAAVMLLRSEGFNVEFVPYVPEKKGTDEVDRIIYQRTSNAGKALTPLEEGFNVKRLLGKGLDVPTIAKRTGRSDTYIEQLLKLQAAPSPVKEMVAKREVSAGLAVKTLASEGEEHGAAILKDAAAAARAQGKRKVSPKEVQKAIQAKDDTKRFRIAWKAKARLLGVRIGQTEFAFAAEVWLDMAMKIASAAQANMELDEREKEEASAKVAEDAAFLAGLPKGSYVPPAEEAEATL